MISVIICSRHKTINARLSENIEKTIGSEYDLIVINNSKNKYSIFEAYNLGIKRSITPIVIFIHEDILFHSKEWGTLILKSFRENKGLGLIGVAGSKIRSKIPSAWWDNPERFLYQNIIHRYPNGESKHEIKGFGNKDKMEEVVVIDGVFVAMRKDANVWFNEGLTGFHNYDQSISIDFIKKGYQVLVTNEILLEHFSLGKIDRTWIKSTLDLNKIYNKKLPIVVSGERITKKDKTHILKKFLNNCRSNNCWNGSPRYWFHFWMLNPKDKLNKKMLNFYLYKIKQKIINE